MLDVNARSLDPPLRRVKPLGKGFWNFLENTIHSSLRHRQNQSRAESVRLLPDLHQTLI